MNEHISTIHFKCNICEYSSIGRSKTTAHIELFKVNLEMAISGFDLENEISVCVRNWELKTWNLKSRFDNPDSWLLSKKAIINWEKSSKLISQNLNWNMKWISGLKPRFEHQVQTWKWKTWKWEAEFQVYFKKSIVSVHEGKKEFKCGKCEEKLFS